MTEANNGAFQGPGGIVTVSGVLGARESLIRRCTLLMLAPPVLFLFTELESQEGKAQTVSWSSCSQSILLPSKTTSTLPAMPSYVFAYFLYECDTMLCVLFLLVCLFMFLF